LVRITQIRIDRDYLEPRPVEKTPRQFGAKPSVERVDRVALGEGHVGSEFDIIAGRGGHGRKQRPGEPALPERGRDADGQELVGVVLRWSDDRQTDDRCSVDGGRDARAIAEGGEDQGVGVHRVGWGDDTRGEPESLPGRGVDDDDGRIPHDRARIEGGR